MLKKCPGRCEQRLEQNAQFEQFRLKRFIVCNEYLIIVSMATSMSS
jgi:hypothetical protein